jgi:inner membrane protein
LPSVFSHAAVSVALSACFYRPEIPKRTWAIGALCSVLPDFDVIGLWLGVPYEAVLGHRGFSHSLTFAALVAAALAASRGWWGGGGQRPGRLMAYLFLVTASHGVLDGMTNGGLGIAFFSPFENSRYFLPFRPIEVSPIGIARFFSVWGVTVFRSELAWVWAPSLAVVAAALGRRRRRAEPALG